MGKSRAMPSCSLPECPFTKDGRCLEGKGDACPNLIVASDEAQSTDDQKEVSTLTAGVSLHSGGILSIDEAREVSCARRAKIVAILGMKDSGKTSLIARIHRMFLEGSMPCFRFGGSRTLLDLEKINWLAMLESGSSSPDSERTSLQSRNSLLHWTIHHRLESVGWDILVNDVSGEAFPFLAARQEECEQLRVIRSASHVVVIVDGGVMSRRELRDDHKLKILNVCRRLLQSGQIGKHTELHCVTTKMDIVASGAGGSTTLQAISDLESSLATQCNNSLSHFKSWRIAARPRDGGLPTEEAIGDLFCSWTATPSDGQALPSQNMVRCQRDFCRFGMSGSTETPL
jgi:hypothetical protein